MPDRRLLDAQALALALDLSAQTIHNWASAGRVARHGRAGRRTLYDIDEVRAFATTRRKRHPRTRSVDRAAIE